MAVTPAALTTLSTDEQAVVTKAEELIDLDLRNKFASSRPVKVRYGLIHFVFDENVRVLDDLIARYVAVGWKVTKYEGKEGKWLNFAV